jgi:polysaccharide export outer membrane protein
MHPSDRKWTLSFAFGFVLICLSCGFCSCGNVREITYLQGSFDTAKLSQVVTKDYLIQKGDLLSIVVFSDNPEATRIYNQSLAGTGGASGAAGASGGSGSTGGYLVDENGFIEFQGLGLIHVDGLTKSQLKDTLNEKLANFLVNPYCTIRCLNNKFTILGEIGHPGVFTIPGDRLSLFEALGMSGDMTFFGRRDNIMVIREVNGKREFARLDITKPEVMASPYFYLQPNDLVIIEPNKKKIAANDQVTLRNIGIAATVISVLAVLYSIFR